MEDELEASELLALQGILAALLSARTTLSVTVLADLLDMESYDVNASLSRLHAVVDVPDDNDMPGLRTLHASFGDYMYSRAPSHIRICQSLGHEALAHGSLMVIAKQLRFNISASRSSYEPNSPKRPDSITLCLEYACMQWVYHVAALVNPNNLDAEIGDTFRPRLLHWLEIMSHLRQVWRAARMLYIAAGIVGSHADSDLARFLRDANSFVASSYEAIERSAAHIYLSALPFADKNSLVYKVFFQQCVGLIAVDILGIGNHGGSTLMSFTGHSGPVLSLAYSGDGLLLVSGSEDGSVRVWNTRTGEETRAPFMGGNGSVTTVDFAHNSQRVASGTESGIVCVWSVTPDQASHWKLKGHSRRVNCIKFSPDGHRLASASDDKTLCLWDPVTAQKHATLLGHTGRVIRVSFFCKGEILASGSSDKTIRLWHSNSGQAVGEPLTTGSSASIDFSPHGETIAGRDKKGVVLWECQTGEQTALLRQKPPSCIQFSSDGLSLVASCGSAVRLWTLHPDPQRASWIDLGSHSAKVNWATFSPDGLYIASASDDATIKIWSAESGQSAVQPLPVHEGEVNSVAVSHDGAVIVSRSENESMRLWNAHTGDTTITSLHRHTEGVISVSISPDGGLIASASKDYTIQLWNTQSGAGVGEPMCDHTGRVRALSFSNNEHWLASASDDKTVCIWDVATQQPTGVGPLHCQRSVLVAVFSPDDMYVAAGDLSGRIYFWRTDTGENAYKSLRKNDTYIWSLAFSTDGTRIVSCGTDTAARIWNIATGNLIHTLQGRKTSIRSVAWSTDATVIGAGCIDGTLRLWDAMTGVALATLRGHTKTVRSVAFTRDGKFIVSGSDDTTIRKWDIRAACRSLECSTDPVAALESAILKNGWLVGSSGELILWVPADYRKYLQVDPALLIDRSRVVIRVGENGLHAGVNWTSCWRGRTL